MRSRPTTSVCTGTRSTLKHDLPGDHPARPSKKHKTLETTALQDFDQFRTANGPCRLAAPVQTLHSSRRVTKSRFRSDTSKRSKTARKYRPDHQALGRHIDRRNSDIHLARIDGILCPRELKVFLRTRHTPPTRFRATHRTADGKQLLHYRATATYDISNSRGTRCDDRFAPFAPHEPGHIHASDK